MLLEDARDLVELTEKRFCGALDDKNQQTWRGLFYPVTKSIVVPWSLVKTGLRTFGDEAARTLLISLVIATILVLLSVFPGLELLSQPYVFEVVFFGGAMVVLCGAPSRLGTEGLDPQIVSTLSERIKSQERSKEELDSLSRTVELLKYPARTRVNILRAGLALLWGIHSVSTLNITQNPQPLTVPESLAATEQAGVLLGAIFPQATFTTLLLVLAVVLSESYAKAISTVYRTVEMAINEELAQQNKRENTESASS